MLDVAPPCRVKGFSHSGFLNDQFVADEAMAFDAAHGGVHPAQGGAIDVAFLGSFEELVGVAIELGAELSIHGVL